MIYRIAVILFMCFHLGQIYAQGERMLVFLQPDSDHYFRNNTLSQLEQFAEQENIEILINDIEEGLPSAITTTPAIVLQTAKGNAVYAGRYAELNTIKNFVRVARINPQPEAIFEKPTVWVKQDGRSQTAIALKITNIQGTKGDVQQKDLEQVIKAGISNGLEGYNFQEVAGLQRSDRLFYLDLHPFVDKNGEVYLSQAIFSQFSCIDPIYEQFDQPWSSTQTGIQDLGKKIGAATAKFISTTLAQSAIGDAWTAVPTTVAVRSLEELGFPLPEDQSGNSKIDFPDSPVPLSWKMTGPINEKTPIIQFNFLAPLDRYAGELRKATGSMSFQDSEQIQSGNFVVDVKSLTMGMESFDAKVLKSYVKAKRYPESSFDFKQIQLNGPLIWGQTTTAAVPGTFEMMGKERPVTMNAQLTPSLDAAGNAILIVQADFSLNITDLFGIKGPDGPSPAKKTLSFNLNFLMEATNGTVGL
ncbi:MAG: YceI family protein [Bacteroidota bacterium]